MGPCGGRAGGKGEELSLHGWKSSKEPGVCNSVNKGQKRTKTSGGERGHGVSDCRPR